MERAVPGPPRQPLRGRTGVRGGWQTGLGMPAQLRTLAAGRDGSLELSRMPRTPLARGVGDPQELHRGPGGMAQGSARTGKLSYTPSCSRKGLKGVTGVRWFSHLLVLQRTKIPQRLLHPTPIQR